MPFPAPSGRQARSRRPSPPVDPIGARNEAGPGVAWGHSWGLRLQSYELAPLRGWGRAPMICNPRIRGCGLHVRRCEHIPF